MRLSTRPVVTSILAVLLPAGLAGAAAAADAPVFAWDDVLAGEGGVLDDGLCALVDPDGHLIVAGESADADGGADSYIRKLHRDTAAVIWEARYEAFDDNDMAVSEIFFDPFDDVVVGGYIRGCVG